MYLHLRLWAVLTLLMTHLAVVTDLGAIPAGVAGSPRELVERTTEELRTAVIREQEAIKKDPNRAIDLVDRIVSPHVDTIWVSKWILGKHWRRATPEQRQQFIDAYRKLLLRIYAVRVGDYTDVEVTYLPVRTNNDKGTRVTVRTQVSHQGKSPVRIDYRLHQKESTWKVYDVIAEGISIVATFRAAVNAEVRNYGIDGLIARLNVKNAQPLSSK
jgi:phospholipid transport system substrate-binding protein